MGVVEFGGPEALQVVEMGEPHAGPGEVRIRVHAATVNPTDTYTRNGSFGFDATGNLVNIDGGLVQGWTALNGNVDTKGPLSKINLPLGTTVPPVQTADASFVGNLPSDVAVGSVRTAKLDVYDAQGNARSLSATYTKVDGTHWGVSLDDGVNAPVTGTIDFGGTPTGTQTAGLTLNYGGVAVDLGKLTDFASMDTIAADTQNGQAAGTLQAFAIGQDGVELVHVDLFDLGRQATAVRGD